MPPHRDVHVLLQGPDVQLYGGHVLALKRTGGGVGWGTQAGGVGGKHSQGGWGGNTVRGGGGKHRQGVWGGNTVRGKLSQGRKNRPELVYI